MSCLQMFLWTFNHSLIGKPEQIKIKHNKKFHELQRLFKINYIYKTNQVLITMVKSSYEIRGLKLNLTFFLNKRIG